MTYFLVISGGYSRFVLDFCLLSSAIYSKSDKLYKFILNNFLQPIIHGF